MRKVSLISLSALCVFIAGCAPSALMLNVAPPVSYDVEFNARTHDTNLKTFTSNQNCTKGSGLRKGCVNFAQGTRGTISFSLKNEGGANSSKCGDAGVRWVITRIDASVTGNLSGDNKGSGWGTSLPVWVRNSFFPIEDPDQGILYEQTVNDGKTSVLFLNLNNHDGEEDLWYQVTASECGSSPVVTKESDPRVENKGIN